MPDAFFSAPKNRKRKRTDTGPAGRKTARTSTSFASSKGNPHVKSQSQSKGKGKQKARDEELDSDATNDSEAGGGVDDMDLRAEVVDPNESGEEDEEETPAEKRLRLAKLYLDSVKDGLGTSLSTPSICLTYFSECTNSAGIAEGEVDAAEIDKEIISARLKQDVMEHAGKVHLFVADSVRPMFSCILTPRIVVWPGFSLNLNLT